MRESQPASEHQHAFRDPRTLTWWTRVLLCVCSIATAAFVWLWFSAGTDGATSPVAIVPVDRFLPHIYWYYPVQWITAVLVLKWIYRANYNVRQLGATEMEFTPWGWAFTAGRWSTIEAKWRDCGRVDGYLVGAGSSPCAEQGSAWRSVASPRLKVPPSRRAPRESMTQYANWSSVARTYTK